MLKLLDLSNNKISEITQSKFHRVKELNMLGSRIDCSCRQISLAMSFNAEILILSCILDTDDINHHRNDQPTFLQVPSLKYSSEIHWSNWRALSAYSTDSTDPVKRVCDGVRIRTRKCVSCSESHKPWCIAQIPQPRERCVTIQSIKIPVNQSDLCHLQDCPSIEQAQTNSSRTNTLNDFTEKRCPRYRASSQLKLGDITFATFSCLAFVFMHKYIMSPWHNLCRLWHHNRSNFYLF